MNAATVAIRVLPSGFDASTAASIAAALGTLVLAYFTWRLADQTKRLAAETEEDVRAEWRPVLVARAGLNVSVNAGDTLAGATVLLRTSAGAQRSMPR
jgi:hypothetical protein